MQALRSPLQLAAFLCCMMGGGRAVYEWLATGIAQPAALAAALSYGVIGTLSLLRARTLLLILCGLQLTAIVVISLKLVDLSVPLWAAASLHYGGIPLITTVSCLITALTQRQPAVIEPIDASR